MISINNLMFFFGKKNKEKTNIYNLIKKSKNKYKEYKTIEKKLKKSLKG